MTNDAELDALLTQSLPAIADEGFSRGVSAKIAGAERKKLWMEMGLSAVVVAILAMFVPTAGIMHLLLHASGDLATSLPFAAGCAALIVTISAMRVWAD
jgi:hypothetical protein